MGHSSSLPYGINSLLPFLNIFNISFVLLICFDLGISVDLLNYLYVSALAVDIVSLGLCCGLFMPVLYD